MDTDKIIQAVREYNAAENSLRRAHAELSAAIPAGLTVMHKKPGDPYFWTYIGQGNTFSESVGGKDDCRDAECVVIEAPGRREEFLPRLALLKEIQILLAAIDDFGNDQRFVHLKMECVPRLRAAIGIGADH